MPKIIQNLAALLLASNISLSDLKAQAATAQYNPDHEVAEDTNLLVTDAADGQ